MYKEAKGPFPFANAYPYTFFIIMYYFIIMYFIMCDA